MAARARRRGREARIEAESATAEDNPPVWGGIEGGRFRPLSDADEAKISEAELLLLETLGLSQATPSMIAKICAAGGSCTQDKRLLFPRALVLKTIKEARRDVVLFGQDPRNDLNLSGHRVHMSSGGGAPGIFDLEDGR